jgi:hypothetical protein
MDDKIREVTMEIKINWASMTLYIRDKDKGQWHELKKGKKDGKKIYIYEEEDKTYMLDDELENFVINFLKRNDIKEV